MHDSSHYFHTHFVLFVTNFPVTMGNYLLTIKHTANNDKYYFLLRNQHFSIFLRTTYTIPNFRRKIVSKLLLCC